MARPCGCGGGGIIVACGTGLSCTGVGTVGDPLQISWEIPLGTAACDAVMDCVGSNLGAGLEYFATAHQLAAKVSTDAGNMLGFGTDNGLLVTGTPDPGIGGVTLAGLATANLLAASYGAGLSIWPDGYRESYEATLSLETLQLVHAPIRRSQEQQLYAVHDRNLAWYSNRDDSPLPSRPANSVAVPWSYEMVVRPSGPIDPPLSSAAHDPDNPYNVLKGYYGFGYPDQQGILRVSEVLETLGRRKCMYLEVKDRGGTAETDNPAYTHFLLADLIVTTGLQKSVIVSSQLPTTDADVPSIKQGLQYCKARGIEIGVHIASQAEADANPPASLAALGVTWVGLSYGLSDATIDLYKSAGFNTMLFLLDRQHQWTRQQQLGVRGAFCADPVYAAAATYGFRYRLINPPTTWPHVFTGQAANYGRCGYSSSLDGVHSKFRGWVDRIAGSAGVLKAGPDMQPPANSGFHMPMGPFCPIFDRDLADPPPVGNYGAPTNYDIEVSVGTGGGSWQTGGQQGLGMFFCVPQDVRLFDLAAARTDTIGYSFSLASNGNFVFRRYSGTVGSFAFEHIWASGWPTTQFVTNRAFRIAVQVRPGTIRCGPLTENGGINGANSRLFTATSPANAGADMHRGAYFYLSFWEAPSFAFYRHYTNVRVVNFA